MSGDGKPWRLAADGVRVRVRLTPKSSRDAIVGIEATPEGPALAARVRAVPEKGAANTAVARVLAAWLGVPPSTVRLDRGDKSRVKILAVSGDPARLSALCAARIAALAPGG